jgi:WD40 repeat protein
MIRTRDAVRSVLREAGSSRSWAIWCASSVLCCAVAVTVHGDESVEGLPVAEVTRESPVRFADEIMPMLAANCTACHNAQVTEGGLSMDSLDRIVAGGDSGPGILAGNAAESLLFLRAAHRQDDPMPPEGNGVGAANLTPEQLGLLGRWIDEGAQAGGLVMRPIDWKPLPPGVGGILAVAMSADGRLTAAARGGRVTLVDTRSGRQLDGSPDGQTTLVDPTREGGVAHADIITSMAFSPTEELLATGSFRTIKLWRSQPIMKLADLPGSAGATLLADGLESGPLILGLADGRIALVDPAADDLSASLRVIGGAGPAVIDGVVTADGTTLYVATADRDVMAYRLPDGQVTGRLTLPAAVGSLALTSGDTRLVTAEADGVVRVWPLPLPIDGGAVISPDREIPGATHPVTAMRELPAVSGHLLAGCGDGIVRLWNLDDGSLVREFSHGGGVAGLAVSGDGSRMATVGGIPGVKLWNVADGVLVSHAQGDFRLADRLAATDADLRVLQQDVEHAKAMVAAAEQAMTAAGEELTKMQEKLAAAEKDRMEKAEASQAAVAAREEGERAAATATASVPLAEAALASAQKLATETAVAVDSAAASLAAFAKATESNVEAAAEATSQLQAAVDATAAAKSASEAAASAAMAQLEKAKAAVNETAAKLEEQKKAEATATAAATTSETALTAARRDHDFATTQQARATEAVPLRQAELAAVEKTLAETQAIRGELDAASNASVQPFTAVTFAPDGREFCCLDASGSLFSFDAVDGLPRRAATVTEGATTIGFRDAATMVVAGGPGMASIWNVRRSWELARTIGGEGLPPALDDDPSGPPVDTVLALAFSPDGSLLASGSGRASRSGEIKLWNVRDGSLQREIPQPHSDTVVAVAFSRDGRRLASGGTDRLAKVHDVAGDGRPRSFEGHTGHVLGVAWQANGRRLASAGADNAIKVWDTGSGEQQRTIGGFGREVTGLAFIGEGEELIASSGDATVRVINAASGGEVRRLNGAADFLQSLTTASSTGAAGGQDGRVLIWDLASPQPLHSIEPSAAR